MNVIDTEGVKPGQLVGLNLKGVSKSDVKNGGNVIVYRQDEAPVEDTALFTAQIVIMKAPAKGLKVGYNASVQCCYDQAPCRLESIVSIINKKTG